MRLKPTDQEAVYYSICMYMYMYLHMYMYCMYVKEKVVLGFVRNRILSTKQKRDG